MRKCCWHPGSGGTKGDKGELLVWCLLVGDPRVPVTGHSSSCSSCILTSILSAPLPSYCCSSCSCTQNKCCDGSSLCVKCRGLPQRSHKNAAGAGRSCLPAWDAGTGRPWGTHHHGREGGHSLEGRVTASTFQNLPSEGCHSLHDLLCPTVQQRLLPSRSKTTSKHTKVFINTKKPICMAANTVWGAVLEKLFLKVPDFVYLSPTCSLHTCWNCNLWFLWQ